MRTKSIFFLTIILLVGLFACEKPDQPEAKLPVPEAVDLGLSVKWASLNVGARTPQDYGYFFAWGETSPKDNAFVLKNYQFNQGGDSWSLTKYNTDNTYGSVTDGKRVLELADDAAYAAYGGAWRMPTSEEVKELCEANFLLRKVVREEGVLGIRVTSAKTGNSIFLPAAGMKYESVSTQRDGELGCYWSSSLSEHTSSMADQFWIIPSLDRKDDVMYKYYQSRFVGASVRAVQ